MSLLKIEPAILDATANFAFGNVSAAGYFYSNGQPLTTGGGGGTPGGANTQVQFNDNGTFSGDAGLVFDKTTDTLTTGNIVATGISGTVYTAAQPNITSVGTLTSVSVSGTTNLGAIGNITITGGATGQVLTTNGSGSLSWSTVSGGGGGGGTYSDSNVVTLLTSYGSNVITTTGNVTAGNIISSGRLLAGSGAGGNITGASLVSSNAFLVNTQIALSGVTAGQIDYDGSAMYLADNTTSGRGILQPVQMYRYTSAGAVLGTAITDYFPSTSSLNLQANSIYDIDAHCYFLKTTAGAVTWTWAFSSGVNFARSYYVGSIATGFTTSPIVAAPLTGFAVVQGGAATTLAHSSIAGLSTGVYHSYHLKMFLITNAACNIRLRVTNGAGTVTPQAGSFYTVRKLGAQAGTFAT